MTQPIDDALARLDEQLLRVQHPLSEHRTPGLSRPEIDEATAPIGLTLPDEVAALWEWQADTLGPNRAGIGDPTAAHLPGGIELRALARAVQHHQLVDGSEAFDYVDYLDRRWLPGLRRGSIDYWIDGGAAADGPAAITPKAFDDAQSWDEVSGHRCQSVTELIEAMADMLEREHWQPRDLGAGTQGWGFGPTIDRAEVLDTYVWVVD